jgi:predicted ATP-grasp superfamily ATP-dependent carboligase
MWPREHWTGIGHLDFIADATLNQLYLLEMNPRWWGALNLAVVNGFDFPPGLVTMALEGEPVAGAFCEPAVRRKSLWILGELIACRAELMQGKWYAPFTSLQRLLCAGRDCSCDDFCWSDPRPLMAETAHYLGRFLNARWRPKAAAFETAH